MTVSDGPAFGTQDRGPGNPKSDRQSETVGSVADEVLRLLDTAHTRALEHGRDEAAPCRYCPICAAITFVRSTSPEVMEHLEAAGSSLLAALRTLSDPRASPPDRERPAATVDKIDLSEDPAWD